MNKFGYFTVTNIEFPFSFDDSTCHWRWIPQPRAFECRCRSISEGQSRWQPVWNNSIARVSLENNHLKTPEVSQASHPFLQLFLCSNCLEKSRRCDWAPMVHRGVLTLFYQTDCLDCLSPLNQFESNYQFMPWSWGYYCGQHSELKFSVSATIYYYYFLIV